MSDKELILILMRQNMMIMGALCDLGMTISHSSGNEELLKSIKASGMNFHKITNEALEGLKEK